MAILIGVHGLDNKPSSQKLKSSWEKSLLEGLNDQNHRLRALPLEISYWADLYYSKPVACEREPYSRRSVAASLSQHAPAPESGREENQALADLSPEAMGKQYPDLVRYYREPELARQTRARLGRLLKQFQDLPILLITHSMGCLIAYDLLSEPEWHHLHCEMVTFGCPLGFPQLWRRMLQDHGSLQIPPSVRTWTNYVDPRDRVACLNLDPLFQSNTSQAGIVDLLVTNDYQNPAGGSNPHKIYGYLRTTPFTRQVVRFLDLGPP